MSYQMVEQQIIAHLEAALGQVPLQQENTRQTSGGTTFVRATLLPSEVVDSTIGVGGYQQLNGLMQIDVMTPIAQTTAEAAELADQIIAQFARGQYLGTAPEQTLIEKSWRVSGRILQTYYQVPVFVQWSMYVKTD